VSEVFPWQDLRITLDAKGILEKEMLQPKEDLKNRQLITENPDYVSGLYRKYAEFVKNNMNSK